MPKLATQADILAVEQEMPFSKRLTAKTVYEQLVQTAATHATRAALTFQLRSGPKDPAETLNWAELKAKVTQTANLFRSLGVTETDVVAYILPNCNEAVLSFLGGATAGIVNPINPTLSAAQIASILRETNAKIVVTLAPFPKADVAQKVDEAVALAPNVNTVLQVDLKRYAKPPLSWIISLIRPKVKVTHKANIADFDAEVSRQPETLSFEETGGDRAAAYFHTGGTTGMPKVAQHRFSGMLYNGWVSPNMIVTHQDVMFCPLPMFHVFAAYPILMTCVVSGAHMVMPTPAGYRGDGVYENFWKLLERYKVTFTITVPTAVAKLMQVPVNADVSLLKYAISGSAALPVELFRKFEKATGVKILEGYGMTEATCLVSVNPVHGESKIGSVGLRFPYSDVRILRCAPDGTITHECAVDEIGEICVLNPGVIVSATYIEVSKNDGLYAGGTHLRTGDLGRIDADGFIFITGRAKDLIIRGGHNIDPAMIEEALAGHEAVAFSGAIGQPDAHAGEVPCVYVELIDGKSVTEAELLDYAAAHIDERAAVPKHLEIVAELPKTAVGKVLKNELRKLAIARVYTQALHDAGIEADVAEVYEDRKLGLVAKLRSQNDAVTDEVVTGVLGAFSWPWAWE